MEPYLNRKELEKAVTEPVPGKQVGIVHLQMVKEEGSLYGMGRFSGPGDAAEAVKPLLELADREMVVVMSLSAVMEPLAVEIAAVGGTSCCCIDVKSIFKHALLNNAVHIICFHNHPSGDPGPSTEDGLVTEKLRKAGELLEIGLADHIIIGTGGYYSFAEHKRLEKQMPDTENSTGARLLKEPEKIRKEDTERRCRTKQERCRTKQEA